MLKKFIQVYVKNHDIVLSDIVDDSSTVSYRLINNYNDMITVSGISLSFAKELVQLSDPFTSPVASVDDGKVRKQRGISTVTSLVFISIFLGLIFGGIFFLS